MPFYGDPKPNQTVKIKVGFIYYLYTNSSLVSPYSHFFPGPATALIAVLRERMVSLGGT